MIFLFFSIFQFASVNSQTVLKVKADYILIKSGEEVLKSGQLIKIVSPENLQKTKGIFRITKASKKGNYFAKKMRGTANVNDKYLSFASAPPPMEPADANANANASAKANDRPNKESKSDESSSDRNEQSESSSTRPKKNVSKNDKEAQLNSPSSSSVVAPSQSTTLPSSIASKDLIVSEVNGDQQKIQLNGNKIDSRYFYSVFNPDDNNLNGKIKIQKIHSKQMAQGVVVEGTPKVGDIVMITNELVENYQAEKSNFNNQEMKGLLLGAGYYWRSDMATKSGDFAVSPGLEYSLGIGKANKTRMWDISLTYIDSPANFKSETFVELSNLNFKYYRLNLSYSALLFNTKFGFLLGTGLSRSTISGTVVNYGPYELKSNGFNIDAKLAYHFGSTIHSPKILVGLNESYFFQSKASGPNTPYGVITLEPKKIYFTSYDISFVWPIFF